MAVTANTRAQSTTVSASPSTQDRLNDAEAELSQLKEQRDELNEKIKEQEELVRRLQEETMTKAQLVERDQRAAYELLQQHPGEWLQAKFILATIRSDYKSTDVLDPLAKRPGIERKTKPGTRFCFTPDRS